MKNFRRLCFAVVLTGVFSISALADGGNTHGPGVAGDTQGVPGQTDTPPSATGITHGPGVTALGETHGPGLKAFGDIGSPGFAAALLALLSLI